MRRTVAAMRSAIIAAATAALVGLAACDKDAQPNTVVPPLNSATQESSATPATTTAAPPSAAKTYDCTALLSNAEAKAATGMDLTLFDPTSGAVHPLDGFTDCGYFASDGTYMQATVWTGPSYTQEFLPLVQAARAGGAEPVTGVGDEAGWSSDATTLGVRVGGTGITIAYEFTSGGAGPADLKGSAVKLAQVVISHL